MKYPALTGVLTFAALAVSTSMQPVEAQLLQRKDLSAAMAVAIADAAITNCRSSGYNISVTVVGRQGEPIVQIRGDHTGPHTTENSLRKAYTARTFRVPSGTLEERVKKDPTLGLVHLEKVIAGRGGLPIKVGEDIVGAVGASGAPGGDKDEVCVQAGLDRVAEHLK
jgi:uncharacterized protein GlcG (DUF336 family)